MNIIDIFLIIPIIWFAYEGFRKGFIIEFATLAALILGIYTALYFSGYAADFLRDNLKMGEKYVPVVAFIITFVIIVFLVYAVGKILERLIDLIALGFLNKLAGSVFGVLKGAVLISIVLLLINQFNADLISSEKKEKSMFYAPVEGIAPMLWDTFRDWNPDDKRIRELEEDMEKMTV